MSLRILLLENIHPAAQEVLSDAGYDVQMVKHSPKESELKQMLKNVEVLGIRSKSQITAPILQSAPHLYMIGAFCIGTDQVDLEAANRLGVPVFNAPYSNTRSVAELVMSEVVALSRQLAERSMQAHRGVWLKSADGSHEVRGKTLGIVGYGHIGSQVSVLAEAFGMRVIFYDVVKKLPLGNSRATPSLSALLGDSDFVSLHVPDTAQTRGMLAARELALMRPGSHLINASRGSVVNIQDLSVALRSGHIAGAAIDVFPQEPSSNDEKFVSELQGISNVILTPHIGGSTVEAQEAIGREVAASIVAYLQKGVTRGAVNFPNVDLPVLHEDSHRILNVHQNVPGVLGEINGIVSDLGVNIQAQYLSTDSKIGYLVMDVAKGKTEIAARGIQELTTSIKTRVLS